MATGAHATSRSYEMIRQAIIDKDIVIATYHGHVREMCAKNRKSPFPSSEGRDSSVRFSALCEAYGSLKAKLHASGRGIAANDLWIVASAIRHSVPLIWNKRSHFERIPDLVLRTEQQP